MKEFSPKFALFYCKLNFNPKQSNMQKISAYNLDTLLFHNIQLGKWSSKQ